MTTRRLPALAMLALAGCAAPPPKAEPPRIPPQALRLTRVSFADLPGWKDAPRDAARAAFARGCAALTAQPDAAPMGGAGYAGTVGDWRAPCAQADFENGFTPYAVGAGDDAGGLFTGYYEGLIRASRTRHGAYQTPVYGLPSDLVRVDLGRFLPKLKGEHVSGKVAGPALVPYADRAAIDAHGAPKAPVLFYTADAIAFFFLQIQGSGRVAFDNGDNGRIAYAGENGQPYTAIGRTLIAEGAMAKDDVSLQSIRAWLLAHPDQARRVMETNRSFIFFREAEGAGAAGTSLTPLGSLAVDLRIHALGVPVYVAADGPDPVQALMVAQDTGGAIRGAVRGDIFFGFGPEAERRAGMMKAPGHLYVLLPKALAARIGAHQDYALTP